MTLADTQVPQLLHKNVPVSGVKVLDEEKGIVEAFVAGIGNKDSVGDIIMPGAFEESLASRTPKGVWSHNWDEPIAKTLVAHEVLPGNPNLPVKMASRGVGGLYVKMQFNLKTQRGRDAYEDVKFFGDEAEWSIGYLEKETSFDADNKANLLHKVELFEYSPVLFGANKLTSTVSVKAHGPDDVVVSGVADEAVKARVIEAVKAIMATGESAKTGSGAGGAEGSTWNGTMTLYGSGGDGASGSGFSGGTLQLSAGGGTATTGTTYYLTLPPTAAEETTGRKVIPGSVEERQRDIMEAIEDENSGYWCWIVATFDAAVVVQLYACMNMDSGGSDMDDDAGGEPDDDPDDKSGYWIYPYTVAADGSVALGDPQAVDVVEVVVAKMAMEQAVVKGLSPEAIEEVQADLLKTVEPLINELELEQLAMDVKAGRVLSAKNVNRLGAAKDAIDEVLKSADARGDDDSEEKDEIVDPLEVKIDVVTERGAIKAHSTDTTDAAWDGPEMKTRLSDEEASLRAAYAWVGPDGDTNAKSSYQFIHHMVSIDEKLGGCEANLSACAAGIGVLNGGPSGTTIPSGDAKGVYDHLAKHIIDGGGEAPEFNKTAWACGELFKSESSDDEQACSKLVGHEDEHGVAVEDSGDGKDAHEDETGEKNDATGEAGSAVEGAEGGEETGPVTLDEDALRELSEFIELDLDTAAVDA